MEDEGERGLDESYLLVKVHVPDLNVQKCLQFPRDQLVWDVKQQCLAALPKVSSFLFFTLFLIQKVLCKIKIMVLFCGKSFQARRTIIFQGRFWEKIWNCFLFASIPLIQNQSKFQFLFVSFNMIRVSSKNKCLAFFLIKILNYESALKFFLKNFLLCTLRKTWKISQD